MSLIIDNSFQLQTTGLNPDIVNNISPSSNSITLLSDFLSNNSYINSTKQNLLTASTILLGIGSNLTSIDYNKITLNKPTNFQSDWNSTIINKPNNFQSDWNSTIINKPTNFQCDYNTTLINKPTNFQCDYNTTLINKPTNFQSDWNSTIINKPTIFNPDLTNIYTKNQVDTIANLSNFYNKTTMDSSLNSKENILTFSAPLTRTTNTIGINLNSYVPFSALSSCNYITNSIATLNNFYNKTDSDSRFTQSNFTPSFVNLNSCNYITNSITGLTNYYDKTTSDGKYTQSNFTPSFVNLNSCNYITNTSLNNYLKLDGTNSMTGNLIVSSATANDLIRINNSSALYYANIRIANNLNSFCYVGIGGASVGGNYQNNMYIQSPTNFVLNTNGNISSSTPNLIILANGNVGIATTNPSTNILQIGGGGRLKIGNGTTDYSLIGTLDTDGATNTRIVISGNTRGLYAGNIDYLATSTGHHLFYTSDTNIERMRIKTDGNVGIGTNNPTAKLHIEHSSTNSTPSINGLYVYNPNNAVNHSSFIGTRIGGSNANKCGYSLDVSGAYGWSIYINGNDTTNKLLRFNAGWDTGGADRFTINYNGQLTRAVDVWHRSSDGISREYYQNNATTFYKSGNGSFIFRNTTETADNFTIDNNGNANIKNSLYINNPFGRTSHFPFLGNNENYIRGKVNIDQDPLYVGGPVNFNSSLDVAGDCVFKLFYMNGFTLNYDIVNGLGGWYLLLNNWWYKGYTYLNYACSLYYTNGYNAVYAVGRIILSPNGNTAVSAGGLIAFIRDVHSPTTGVSVLNGEERWNATGGNFLRFHQPIMDTTAVLRIKVYG